MTHWMMWVAACGALVALEIISGTFYLLMISLGAGAGAIAAFIGLGLEAQYIGAALIAGASTFALRKSKYGALTRRGGSQRDRNVNLDIGERLRVSSWTEQGAEHVSRCAYRGAQWDVQLMEGAPIAGEYEICEIQGSRLLVRPAH